MNRYVCIFMLSVCYTTNDILLCVVCSIGYFGRQQSMYEVERFGLPWKITWTVPKRAASPLVVQARWLELKLLSIEYCVRSNSIVVYRRHYLYFTLSPSYLWYNWSSQLWYNCTTITLWHWCIMLTNSNGTSTHQNVHEWPQHLVSLSLSGPRWCSPRTSSSLHSL